MFNFEGIVIDVLKANGIKANSIKKKGRLNGNDEREFQCDCAFALNNDLVLVECKAFTQPFSSRSFYEYINKKEEAIEQFKSIAEFYTNNIDYVREAIDLDDSWNPRNVVKIILTTVYSGMNESIGEYNFMDFSTFKSLVDRNPPSINILDDKKIRKFTLKNYPMYEGKLTANKLMNCIKMPPSVDLEYKRSEKTYIDMTVGNVILRSIRWKHKFDSEIPLGEMPEGHLERMGRIYGLE
ncbi:MAG: hypothetical protein U9Q80_04230 [Bacillota bacterium]|nr:hypothetical protein [Bacillota bacterium]